MKKNAPPFCSFADSLRDILLNKASTPTQLSIHSQIGKKTIERWLNGKSIPKALSVLKLSETLKGHKDELLLSALFNYHFSKQSNFSKELKFEKSISAYLNTDNNWHEKFDLIGKTDLAALWEYTVINNFESLKRLLSEEKPVSELILLPEPKIIITEEWNEILKHISVDSSILYQLPWKKFEDLIAHILSKYHWEVTPMGYTKDDGVDIIAVKRIDPNMKFSMMVQCKRLSKDRKVEVDLVREVWSVKWEKGFHQAMIATTSSFTKGALKKGENWDLSLQDHNCIKDWCSDLILKL